MIESWMEQSERSPTANTGQVVSAESWKRSGAFAFQRELCRALSCLPGGRSGQVKGCARIVAMRWIRVIRCRICRLGLLEIWKPATLRGSECVRPHATMNPNPRSATIMNVFARYDETVMRGKADGATRRCDANGTRRIFLRVSSTAYSLVLAQDTYSNVGEHANIKRSHAYD